MELETEALLLEILSEYQVSIPELGTVRATQIPLVFLTSNNTRELSEALKRRCLFLHIDYPGLEREKEIVLTRVPGISDHLADQIVRIVRSIRSLELKKHPSVSETLDWARTLVLLGIETLTTLALHSYLPVHIFLGLLVIPPVALKLASTDWRFLRYYTNNGPYRREGPPRLLLRLLAPFLIASTLTLFASGVGLIVVGHGGGPLLQLHAVSFAVWGVLIAIHILAYLTQVLRVGLAVIAVSLMKVIGLTLAGGIILLWVCWRFWRDISGGAHHQAGAPDADVTCPWTFTVAKVTLWNVQRRFSTQGVGKYGPAVEPGVVLVVPTTSTSCSTVRLPFASYC